MSNSLTAFLTKSAALSLTVTVLPGAIVHSRNLETTAAGNCFVTNEEDGVHAHVTDLPASSLDGAREIGDIHLTTDEGNLTYSGVGQVLGDNFHVAVNLGECIFYEDASLSNLGGLFAKEVHVRRADTSAPKETDFGDVEKPNYIQVIP